MTHEKGRLRMTINRPVRLVSDESVIIAVLTAFKTSRPFSFQPS